MNRHGPTPTEYLLWVILFVPLLWLAVALAQAHSEAGNLAQMLEILSRLANAPLSVHWTADAPKLVLIVSILYPMLVVYRAFWSNCAVKASVYAGSGNPGISLEKYRKTKSAVTPAAVLPFPAVNDKPYFVFAPRGSNARIKSAITANVHSTKGKYALSSGVDVKSSAK